MEKYLLQTLPELTLGQNVFRILRDISLESVGGSMKFWSELSDYVKDYQIFLPGSTIWFWWILLGPDSMYVC